MAGHRGAGLATLRCVRRCRTMRRVHLWLLAVGRAFARVRCSGSRVAAATRSGRVMSRASPMSATGRGEVCPLVGGGSHGRGPVGDGLPLLGDGLAASGDEVDRLCELGPRRLESRAGLFDPGPVPTAPMPAAGDLDRSARLGELAVQYAERALMVAEVGLGATRGRRVGRAAGVAVSRRRSSRKVAWAARRRSAPKARGSSARTARKVTSAQWCASVSSISAMRLSAPGVGMVPRCSGCGGLLQAGDVGVGRLRVLVRLVGGGGGHRRAPRPRGPPRRVRLGGAGRAARARRARSRGGRVLRRPSGARRWRVRARPRASWRLARGSGGRVATTAACSSRSARRRRSRVQGSSWAARVLASSRAHGVEHGLARCAVVGQEAEGVVGFGTGVPGVGGCLAAGLTDVAGEPVQRGRAEQVHLPPGATLGAVDGSRPRVRDVRGAVRPKPADKVRVEVDLVAGVKQHVEPGRRSR